MAGRDRGKPATKRRLFLRRTVDRNRPFGNGGHAFARGTPKLGCENDETNLLGGRPLGPADQGIPQGLGNQARLGLGFALPELAEVFPGRPVDAGSEQDGGEDGGNSHQTKGNVEKVDHIAHLGPSVAAGIGTMLKLNTETIYQAIQQALHTTISTRQSRKGEISSWKAYAPAHAGKLAIEAVDRVMRGEGAPSPIYEGEDSVIARILDGKKAIYKIPLPKKNETKKAILETYTKEYSAEYQSQALIDLAKKLRKNIQNLNQIKKIDIYTSHHTHYVIGTGANDPQKMDPNASRETLDHSIMYIFAVALEDGSWHHVKSYSKARAKRKSTIKIWRSIKTHEDKKWTKRYHDPNPRKKAFGAKVTITLKNGKKITEEQGVADAHPYGSRPFKRKNYINKFLTLTESILDKKEIERFLKTVQNLRKLKSGQLDRLNIIVKKSKIKRNLKKGIF